MNVHDAGGDARAGDHQRDVPVLSVVPAVLGDLAGLAGVDHPVPGDPDQVRDPPVAGRRPDELIGGAPGQDLAQAR